MAEPYIDVKNSIIEACIKCGRNPDDVKLLAVSKFHSIGEIEKIYDLGQRSFGENRVQEAVEKFPDFLRANPDCELHMIGSLQTNKVKKIIPYAAVIQSLDRLELAREIQKRALNYSEQNPDFTRKIKVFFEIHTGEESKAGFSDIEELYRTLEYIKSLDKPFIEPKGFMTMAPNTENTKLIRKSFETLRLLRDEVQKNYPDFNLEELSMGMSSDYRIAIEEGSTLLRIGTAIFGERLYNIKK